MRKTRIITFLVFMGVFSLAFEVGATSQISDEDANAFVQEFLSNTQDVGGGGIFANNSLAALPMFIPGFGAVWGAYTGWSTGTGFASMAVMAPTLAEIEPLSILYLSPFGIMELAAYSIAMSRSCHITLALIKRKNTRHLLRPTSIEIGMVIVLLLVAGYVEEYMIGLAGMP